MSKNIEEIVESVLPYDYKYTSDYLHSRDLLKQALTEGKLVVPMSEEEIFKLLASKFYDLSVKDLAKAIYQTQFGGNK